MTTALVTKYVSGGVPRLIQSGVGVIRSLTNEETVNIINGVYATPVTGYGVNCTFDSFTTDVVYDLGESKTIQTIVFLNGYISNIRISANDVSYSSFVANTDMKGRYIKFTQQSGGSYGGYSYSGVIPKITVTAKDLCSIIINSIVPTRLYGADSVCKVDVLAIDKLTGVRKNIQLYLNDTLSVDYYKDQIKEIAIDAFNDGNNALKILAEDGAIETRTIVKELMHRTSVYRTFNDYDGGFNNKNVYTDGTARIVTSRSDKIYPINNKKEYELNKYIVKIEVV